ncbi:MAG: toxin-antitoxin system HicB family antitoxin, partial [candidate division NC10 bacterium]|nr:toxin-antitoxin system HicB family antitoxin [candidate division NC10 bacterium]
PRWGEAQDRLVEFNVAHRSRPPLLGQSIAQVGSVTHTISGRAKIEIPVPLDKQPVSGRYALRMPPDLYRELVFEAKAQGLSLNQFIVHKLSRAVG